MRVRCRSHPVGGAPTNGHLRRAPAGIRAEMHLAELLVVRIPVVNEPHVSVRQGVAGGNRCRAINSLRPTIDDQGETITHPNRALSVSVTCPTLMTSELEASPHNA